MMTARLWRALPGPRWVRALVVLLAAAVVIAVLFEVVFPWLTTVVPLLEQTVE